MRNPENHPDQVEPGLRDIVRAAGELPELAPSRDLWAGIAARIEAPVVALPTHGAGRPLPEVAAPAPAPAPDRLPWRRLAVAASLLVAATAGVTYTLARRARPEPAAAADSAGPQVFAPLAPVQPASLETTEQTFDREIGALRGIVDERRTELDPATVAVLEKNLKVIDNAIAESKAALARDPASAFLLDRLTHAYDTKLQLLRGVATIPPRG